jgi:hypothetical protein
MKNMEDKIPRNYMLKECFVPGFPKSPKFSS